MTQLTLTFLGTGASYPTPQRGLSCMALRRGGDVLMFDCGEGTQRQIQSSGISYQQVRAIFLTHYHGDHCFGVPGLLKTMALNERTEPLTLYGPRGLERMVSAYRMMGGWPKEFPITVTELEAGQTVTEAGATITTFAGQHSVNNLIYRLDEPDRPGKFDKPKALELGVKEGPQFGALQKGKSVETEGGKTVTPADVMGPPRPGRSVVYTGDTKPCAELTKACKFAQVIVCEATFLDAEVERARLVKHMCASEAATVALEASSLELILTHISPRYKESSEVLAEATPIFANTRVASDLESFEVGFPEVHLDPAKR